MAEYRHYAKIYAAKDPYNGKVYAKLPIDCHYTGCKEMLVVIAHPILCHPFAIVVSS